ncbi:hypothetical protein ACH4Q7_22565 [Streptomyces roseolus]|uniref:hypothetical protein n=1 Tax=Streptomyces roseolus TaxID=67358 RepID=UPI0037B2A33D
MSTDQEAPEADVLEDEEPEAKPPFRVRDVFQFRRRPVEPKPDAADGEDTEEEPAVEDAAPAVPPMPPEPPAIPVPRVGRAARADDHHVPDWWNPQKDITLGAPGCKHPNPYTFKVQETGEVVPHWCPDCDTDLTTGLPAAKPPAAKPPMAAPKPIAVSKEDADEDDVEDQDDEDAQSDEERETEEAGEEPCPSIRQRLGHGIRGGGGSYSRPSYGQPAAARKKTLLDALTKMAPRTRHLIYNGSALGVGFYMGVPQFVTAEVAYLVATYDSWTDFYVCLWYAAAVGVWLLDHRSRRWFPIFAWLTRIPLVSMIVGVLLYGTPAA